jgi:hypothetical protein
VTARRVRSPAGCSTSTTARRGRHVHTRDQESAQWKDPFENMLCSTEATLADASTDQCGCWEFGSDSRAPLELLPPSTAELMSCAPRVV